ncbi:helix-turn-helix domain-containing protein [Ralstonia sp. GP101]|uniref:AlbA family DNA-binding domain-containing protein n=1 Tax=Ralstonia sp. GP101 TaxID=3035146 RepID=UPI003891ACE6
MTIEPWADAQLSEDIPRLAQGGESETVEFKRELPKQVRDLAKEIAAFASSSGGRLLLGVADDGSIPGVENAHDPAVRDDLGRRIVGVCQIIDPPSARRSAGHRQMGSAFSSSLSRRVQSLCTTWIRARTSGTARSTDRRRPQRFALP